VYLFCASCSDTAMYVCGQLHAMTKTGVSPEPSNPGEDRQKSCAVALATAYISLTRFPMESRRHNKGNETKSESFPSNTVTFTMKFDAFFRVFIMKTSKKMNYQEVSTTKKCVDPRQHWMDV